MSKLLLIVEDNRVCGEVLAAYFRRRGYRTAIARDGVEGLAAARGERPDAIVLDVAMPRMDGVQFLETIRREGELAATPVVVTTAVTDAKVGERLTALGVAGYTVKGQCSLEELFQLVNGNVGAAPECKGVGVGRAA